VAVYITIGIVFKLSVNAYQLVGIPLMLAFQLLIRKKPIYQLWVKDATDFRFNKWAILFTIVIAVYPAKEIIFAVTHGNWNIITLGHLEALLGAVAAGYSLSRWTKKTTPSFFLCLLIAGGLGIIMFVGVAFAKAYVQHQSIHPDMMTGIRSMLNYFPVCFVIEEVVFRGLLDSHVHRPGDARGILSAAFVSALWGLWHAPVVIQKIKADDIPTAIASLVIVHTILGVPLSLYFRKSGNLAVTSFTHALIDSVRNALVGWIS
jgi:membrane protease YdiL (CAAX protease family)